MTQDENVAVAQKHGWRIVVTSKTQITLTHPTRSGQLVIPDGDAWQHWDGDNVVGHSRYATELEDYLARNE